MERIVAAHRRWRGGCCWVLSMNEITPPRFAKPVAGDPAGTDFVALIEAAYRVGAGDADWLRRILACAQPGLDRGWGLVGCLFAAGPGGATKLTLAMGSGALPAGPEALAAAFLPTLAVRAGSARAGAICATVPATGRGETRAVSGIVVVAVADDDGPAAGCGCALLAPLARPAALSREAGAIWSRIAAHLRSALCIRQAASHEQAIWWGLLCGRWRLVDHFDAAGRRFVIARGNPHVASPRPLAHLSRRERAACARAAEGRANKVIAAELGVTVSTVGNLLRRASHKLGCGSRVELIRAFRVGEERWHQDESARSRSDRDGRYPSPPFPSRRGAPLRSASAPNGSSPVTRRS
jgi:DNA-binding CsgD family transcriptional regulator